MINKSIILKHTHDLEEGTSTFYAELKNLKP